MSRQQQRGLRPRLPRLQGSPRPRASADPRFEAAFSNAPIGMALVDTSGRWLQVNDSLCRITGYTRAELTSKTLRELGHPDEVDLEVEELQQLLAGELESTELERRYRHAFGHYAWVLLTVSVVRAENGAAPYLIAQVQDIAARKQFEEHLEYLVDHDFLTGLFNRRRFEQELRDHAEQRARYGAVGALLLIDLDNFKDVNDSFGHKAGDDLLKGISGLLRERVRRTDVLARVGGDEFGVLLPRVTAAQAETVADELVKSLQQHVAVLGEQRIRTSVSVGIAAFDSGLSDVQAFTYADQAMYEAKAAGRNRFAVYHPRSDGKAPGSTRLADAERLRAALEDDRFILYCQPIVDLATGDVSQYELLLRLLDERSGDPLTPGSFLYSAERFGLMPEIDAWVARQGVALVAEHARAGRELVLEINLSGKSIGDPKLRRLIETLLIESRIDPSSLIFEVTETAAVANIDAARSFAQRLHELGCRVALDDFGVGFGSFFYLKNLPFDYLKIDGDFIRGLAEGSVDQLVVEAIVGIARGMGKGTVAEFVPDGDVLGLLRTIGVDYAQGYFVGKPEPVADVLSLA